jgi:hypothetical protein
MPAMVGPPRTDPFSGWHSALEHCQLVFIATDFYAEVAAPRQKTSRARSDGVG